MKNSSEISRILPFYLFVSGVFLMLVFQDIFSNGMFLDGLIYSTVSKNLANGLGTFWNPHFTMTCLPDFHEHPPLAFGIQSLFYSVLGGSRFVDRVYSLLTVIITGLVILKIWKRLGFENGWLPLLIWLVTPTVFWASYNNLLENTVAIFTSLSVLFLLMYQDRHRFVFLCLSGFMLSLGFLTKGFVSFFPWTFPFLIWIFLKKESFGKMITGTFWIFFFTIGPLLLLILISTDARLSLQKYIDNQVINSIRNVVTVSSRFDIVKRFLSEIAPAGLLCLILLVAGRIRKTAVKPSAEDIKKALVFLSLCLTGVLPIMISLKQSGFYILPVYPFFAIAAGILLSPYVNSLTGRINYESKGFLVFRLLSFGLFALGIILSFSSSGGYSRDKIKITDTKTILKEIPEATIINILPDMYEDWGLHSYYARFKNISLDPDINNKRSYLLIKSDSNQDTLSLRYEIVNLNTKSFLLYRMRQVPEVNKTK
jgi:4-amino-4-deoxy-L-arabinose transferase-like glycosyltransferase